MIREKRLHIYFVWPRTSIVWLRFCFFLSFIFPFFFFIYSIHVLWCFSLNSRKLNNSMACMYACNCLTLNKRNVKLSHFKYLQCLLIPHQDSIVVVSVLSFLNFYAESHQTFCFFFFFLLLVSNARAFGVSVNLWQLHITQCILLLLKSSSSSWIRWIGLDWIGFLLFMSMVDGGCCCYQIQKTVSNVVTA